MQYRNLSAIEINELTNQNCFAIDGWEKVNVHKDFTSANIRNVTFSGKNYLGKFSSKIKLSTATYDFSGIYNAHLHNCTINNNCYIKNIGTSISNYNIENDVIIQNVGTLITEKESYFGNGVAVSPVNETGGREIKIYDELSAHTAYIMVFYKHKPNLVQSIESAIEEKILSKKATHGIIKKNAILTNCVCIKNTQVGEFAHIEGAQNLYNGTVNSSFEAPTFIGYGVHATDFIISSGSIVKESAILKQCFIGQGVEIANSFTAENSLFFANSQCLQGEACSIFAGPFTVTHHKSTLLIAGYYSFFNAGSGTNQSNHMYKLGPVHQGIVERGGKTGSGSYILWPAQIGAFTMILGRHYGNPDISHLPFSYLIENNGKSVLMPAQNIFNVGITRDEQKWKKRDKRKGNLHLDYLVTDILNPFTIDKIIEGISVLKKLQTKTTPQSKNLMYKNAQISLTSIIRGIKLYEQALVKYIGEELIIALKHTNFDNVKASFVEPDNQWVDLSGLICNTSSLDKHFNEIEKGKTTVEDWDIFYQYEFKSYPKQKLNHALGVLKDYFNIDINSCGKKSIADFILKWNDNNTVIKKSIIMDAKKEFNVKSKISFGIDGDAECREKDFESVRGQANNNLFIEELELNFKQKSEDVKKIINILNN